MIALVAVLVVDVLEALLLPLGDYHLPVQLPSCILLDEQLAPWGSSMQ